MSGWRSLAHGPAVSSLFLFSCPSFDFFSLVLIPYIDGQLFLSIFRPWISCTYFTVFCPPMGQYASDSLAVYDKSEHLQVLRDCDPDKPVYSMFVAMVFAPCVVTRFVYNKQKKQEKSIPLQIALLHFNVKGKCHFLLNVWSRLVKTCAYVCHGASFAMIFRRGSKLGAFDTECWD